MMMAWFASLALIAGSADQSPAGDRPDRERIARAPGTATPSPIRCIGRGPRHDPDGVPSPDVRAEVCDTEEGVDETWLGHLDSRDTIAFTRLEWERPRSISEPDRPGGSGPTHLAAIPLRC